ncbi:MAG: hypothetical protein LBU07_05135 [Coriobacteriales bacterium]|jgi:hypothetical protein|nr:hypothetical protein [Coriobacteriales bacterium]
MDDVAKRLEALEGLLSVLIASPVGKAAGLSVTLGTVSSVSGTAATVSVEGASVTVVRACACAAGDRVAIVKNGTLWIAMGVVGGATRRALGVPETAFVDFAQTTLSTTAQTLPCGTFYGSDVFFLLGAGQLAFGSHIENTHFELCGTYVVNHGFAANDIVEVDIMRTSPGVSEGVYRRIYLKAINAQLEQWPSSYTLYSPTGATWRVTARNTTAARGIIGLTFLLKEIRL